jgi:hypothetical protein
VDGAENTPDGLVLITPAGTCTAVTWAVAATVGALSNGVFFVNDASSALYVASRAFSDFAFASDVFVWSLLLCAISALSVLIAVCRTLIREPLCDATTVGGGIVGTVGTVTTGGAPVPESVDPLEPASAAGSNAVDGLALVVELLPPLSKR